jgi:hypothetical protein
VANAIAEARASSAMGFTCVTLSISPQGRRLLGIEAMLMLSIVTDPEPT